MRGSTIGTSTQKASAPSRICFLLELTDSRGDGWNGARYEISDVPGGNILENGTMDDGFRARIDLCLAPGSYAIGVTAGLHDDEVGWSLGAGALRGAAPEPGQSFVVTGEGSLIGYSSRDLLETTTFGCSESRATTEFSSIANKANVWVLGIVSNSFAAIEAVNLSFAFPWFGSTVTSLVVSANGQIIMDGAEDINCCGADEISDVSLYKGDRIALAQGYLNPFAGGTVYYLAKEQSVVFSYEAVPFYYDVGEVNAQVELFENGLIEMRWEAGELPATRWHQDCSRTHFLCSRPSPQQEMLVGSMGLLRIGPLTPV